MFDKVKGEKIQTNKMACKQKSWFRMKHEMCYWIGCLKKTNANIYNIYNQESNFLSITRQINMQKKTLMQ